MSREQTHRSITPPESPLRPLLGARESSSSKKIIHGEAAFALENTKKENKTCTLKSILLYISFYFPQALNQCRDTISIEMIPGSNRAGCTQMPENRDDKQTNQPQGTNPKAAHWTKYQQGNPCKNSVSMQTTPMGDDKSKPSAVNWKSHPRSQRPAHVISQRIKSMESPPSRTFSSLCPTYMFSSSGPLTLNQDGTSLFALKTHTSQIGQGKPI